MSLRGTHVLIAVVVLLRAFNDLTAMLSHPATQTLASRLEVVLVHTPAGRGTIDAEAFAGFGAFKMVEVSNPVTSTSSSTGSPASVRAKRHSCSTLRLDARPDCGRP
jgi:hypothetical protein